MKTLGVDEKLLEYVRKNFSDESEACRKLRIEVEKHPCSQMQILPEQASFIKFIVGIKKVKTYLEIGVFMGYSSLSIAEILPEDGVITALDSSEEFTSVAMNHWKNAHVGHKIELMVDDAISSLEGLMSTRTEFYDFIFIDADKKNYIDYYEKALLLLKNDGIIIVDNVLWRGHVADESNSDKITASMKKFNSHVSKDKRVESIVLPFADGMMLIKKR